MKKLFMRLLVAVSVIVFALSNSFGVVQAISPLPEYDQENVPIHRWQPEGQDNVINHQGGDSNGWDGVGSWSGEPNDLTNSYLKFGNPQNPDFKIRKYATQTDTPGIYDIYLNVAGNKKTVIKPLEIVLTVDMSASMKGARIEAVRTGIAKFMQQMIDNHLGDVVRVGLITYSSQDNTDYINDKVDMDSVSNNQQTINDKLSQEPNGGTFTQKALIDADEMFESQTSSDSKKLLILLTDGVPTYAYKVTSATIRNGIPYATSWDVNTVQKGVDSAEFTGRDGIDDDYWVNYWPNRIHIRDTWAATLGTAYTIKSSGVEINTLGIQLGADKNYHTAAEVKNRMQWLSSKYEDAITDNDIDAYLERQANDIVAEYITISKGIINDPLGDKFDYVDTSKVEVTDVGSVSVKDSPIVQIEDRKLIVSNLNLGENQEIQIHYQVKINSSSDDFVFGKWYPMNQRTTLLAQESSELADFGIPVGRTVEKHVLPATGSSQLVCLILLVGSLVLLSILICIFAKEARKS